MNFQEYDLGLVPSGKTVEVKLSNSAIVRIMNKANYIEYSLGYDHQFIGGYIKDSVYRAVIPNTEHWFVVVDLGGYCGNIISSARVLPDAD
ncbi:MAG: DUF1883 domain-containing protein [Clostridiales bacterium]|nr:DUF1883 domain-containing protein [Clostridiales bacterium]